MHAVVEAVVAVGEPGCLDDSLLLILPLMEVRTQQSRGLVGAVAAATHVAGMQRCRGACTCVLTAPVPLWHYTALTRTRAPSHASPLSVFLPCPQADLFGEVAEAKEASEFAAAYKEAKKCRG